MNKWEIACFIIGCIGIIDTITIYSKSGENKIQTVSKYLFAFLIHVIFASMVFLPLYFNFWKK